MADATTIRIVKPLDHIAMPVQVLLQVNTPVDGHAFSITIDGLVYTFEFNSVGGVTAGRIAVPIGANNTATAVNVADTLRPVIGAWVFLSADGGYVDMLARHPDTDFTAAILSGPSLLGPTNIPQRSLATILIAFNREVFQADVNRGKMVVLMPLDTIAFIYARYQVSGGNADTVAWTGQVIVPSVGRIELLNGGARPYVVGNFLQLIVTGDRYE